MGHFFASLPTLKQFPVPPAILKLEAVERESAAWKINCHLCHSNFRWTEENAFAGFFPSKHWRVQEVSLLCSGQGLTPGSETAKPPLPKFINLASPRRHRILQQVPITGTAGASLRLSLNNCVVCQSQQSKDCIQEASELEWSRHFCSKVTAELVEGLLSMCGNLG